MNAQTILTPAPSKPVQFLAWAKNVPYLVTFTRNGSGYFDLFVFVVADSDFRNSLADQPRELSADPGVVQASKSPSAYIEAILERAA